MEPMCEDLCGYAGLSADGFAPGGGSSTRGAAGPTRQAVVRHDRPSRRTVSTAPDGQTGGIRGTRPYASDGASGAPLPLDDVFCTGVVRGATGGLSVMQDMGSHRSSSPRRPAGTPGHVHRLTGHPMQAIGDTVLPAEGSLGARPT